MDMTYFKKYPRIILEKLRRHRDRVRVIDKPDEIRTLPPDYYPRP